MAFFFSFSKKQEEIKWDEDADTKISMPSLQTF